MMATANSTTYIDSSKFSYNKSVCLEKYGNVSNSTRNLSDCNDLSNVTRSGGYRVHPEAKVVLKL